MGHSQGHRQGSKVARRSHPKQHQSASSPRSCAPHTAANEAVEASQPGLTGGGHITNTVTRWRRGCEPWVLWAMGSNGPWGHGSTLSIDLVVGRQPPPQNLGTQGCPQACRVREELQSESAACCCTASSAKASTYSITNKFTQPAVLRGPCHGLAGKGSSDNVAAAWCSQLRETQWEKHNCKYLCLV